MILSLFAGALIASSPKLLRCEVQIPEFPPSQTVFVFEEKLAARSNKSTATAKWDPLLGGPLTQPMIVERSTSNSEWCLGVRAEPVRDARSAAVDLAWRLDDKLPNDKDKDNPRCKATKCTKENECVWTLTGAGRPEATSGGALIAGERSIEVRALCSSRAPDTSAETGIAALASSEALDTAGAARSILSATGVDPDDFLNTVADVAIKRAKQRGLRALQSRVTDELEKPLYQAGLSQTHAALAKFRVFDVAASSEGLVRAVELDLLTLLQHRVTEIIKNEVPEFQRRTITKTLLNEFSEAVFELAWVEFKQSLASETDPTAVPLLRAALARHFVPAFQVQLEPRVLSDLMSDNAADFIRTRLKVELGDALIDAIDSLFTSRLAKQLTNSDALVSTGLGYRQTLEELKQGAEKAIEVELEDLDAWATAFVAKSVERIANASQLIPDLAELVAASRTHRREVIARILLEYVQRIYQTHRDRLTPRFRTAFNVVVDCVRRSHCSTPEILRFANFYGLQVENRAWLESFVVRFLDVVRPPTGMTSNRRLRIALVLWLETLREVVPDQGARFAKLIRGADSLIAREYQTALPILMNELANESDSRRVTQTIGALLSLVHSYGETNSIEELELRQEAREQAVESFIDSMAARGGANGTVGTIGVTPGLAAGFAWLENRDQERAAGVSLPFGIGIQTIGGTVDLHTQVAFFDLGQYTEFVSNREEDDIEWEDALMFGLQLGLLFPKLTDPEVPLTVAFDARVRRNRFESDEDYEARIAIHVGFYVPFFDF